MSSHPVVGGVWAFSFSFSCGVFCFVCIVLCLVDPMLVVSLDCSFVIALSDFSRV